MGVVFTNLAIVWGPHIVHWISWCFLFLWLLTDKPVDKPDDKDDKPDDKPTVH